jgi:MATE family multidrug resistance protein
MACYRTFLGNNEPVKARRAAYSALSIGLASTGVTAILTYALRYKLPLLFTTWDEAIQIAADVTQVVCFCLVFDGMQLICSGILRGVGTCPRPLLRFWAVGGLK